MAGMNSCSSEYKALGPRETIKKERLVHSSKNVIEQECNNLFDRRRAYKHITWDSVYDNEIVEDTLDCVEKGDDPMNQFLIERIYHNPIPFQSPTKKNKFKSFRDAVEWTEVSSCWKTKSVQDNWYILRPLMLFSIQPKKAII